MVSLTALDRGVPVRPILACGLSRTTVERETREKGVDLLVIGRRGNNRVILKEASSVSG